MKPKGGLSSCHLTSSCLCRFPVSYARVFILISLLLISSLQRQTTGLELAALAKVKVLLSGQFECDKWFVQSPFSSSPPPSKRFPLVFCQVDGDKSKGFRKGSIRATRMGWHTRMRFFQPLVLWIFKLQDCDYHAGVHAIIPPFHVSVWIFWMHCFTIVISS